MPRRPLAGSNAAAVAVASFASIIISDGSHSPSRTVNALISTRTTAFLPIHQRTRSSLYARKESDSSRSTVVIEEVKPLTSASEERRLNALEALTRQRLNGAKSITDMEDDPLFAGMDAATILLESFITTNDNEESTPPSKRMNSVPGASSVALLRQQAAEENARQRAEEENGRYMQVLSESDEQLYNYGESNNGMSREDLSEFLEDENMIFNQKMKKPELVFERLDEKLQHYDSIDSDSKRNIPGLLNSNAEKLEPKKKPVKSKKGRPRKKKITTEKGKQLQEVELLGQQKLKSKDTTRSKETKSSRVTGGSLINKRDKQRTSEKSTPKLTVSKGSAKLAEPLMSSNAMVKNKRRQVVKQLPKSRRDENGNLSQSTYEQKNIETQVTAGDMKGSKLNDPISLNVYYRTELLTAKEEYSLGMKVKFMVKCDAVYEGLSNALERTPTIAEWATACGFQEYDPIMCSEDYVENDLDREIRPSNTGNNDEQLAPNMFLGNGLVTDSGVGRGKGRAKKPPPNSLGKFYDDSYVKFKRKNGDNAEGVDEDDDDETDVFLYQQKMYPGEPINQGSPRLFREMMLTAKEAKQRMVQCNMRLVVSIARRYHGVGVSVQDLVQEGSLGLSRAAEKFDPKKGFKFSTYASWWIQQAVFRSIAYHSRTIRLPVHVHNLLNKVRRARQVLQQELGRMPSNEEVAAEMDMTIEKYNKMIRSTRHAISLEKPKYKNNPKDMGHESEALVGDMVDSTAVIFDEKTPEQNVDHGLFHNDIEFMLGKLGDDERTVLCLRYGIKDGITRTVTLVASEMRQTKSWVRSQECRALRKLRRPWYERRLKEHKESLQASNSLPL